MFRMLVLVVLASGMSLAQQGTLGGKFAKEGDNISKSCAKFEKSTLAACPYEFFTDHPMHIAAGSIAPQNGFGMGVAFVDGTNPRNWRMSWDVDAIAAPSVMNGPSGSWRAGAYMKLVHTPPIPIHVEAPSAAASSSTHSRKKHLPTIPIRAEFNFYVQAISLGTVDFYGIGDATSVSGRSLFGMTQTIVGGNVTKPLTEIGRLRWLHPALQGEINGRFVDLRGAPGQSAPSIEAVYNAASAPGLNNQPPTVQFGEGIRLSPSIAARLQFDYQAKFQQFVAPSDSHSSFLRWTLDLNHTFTLYRSQYSVVPGANRPGPDSCAAPGVKCPPISYTRNREGSFSLRLLLSESITSASSAVPLYFQPTLGGSDINGAMALPSYADYRYRAPNLYLFQETFEHSLWGPIGIKLMADQGRVASTRGDLDFTHLRHSFAGGLTLRAGAFPLVNLMFAWGGDEGHHNIFTADTSLLGASARPSLY